MRWIKNNNKPSFRINKRFLLFPKTIGDLTRWFEFATWEQELVYVFHGFDDPACPEWHDTKWLDI